MVLNDLAGKQLIRSNYLDVYGQAGPSTQARVLTPLGEIVSRLLTVVATTDRDDEPAPPTG